MIGPHVTVAGPCETSQSVKEVVDLAAPLLRQRHVPLVFRGVGTFLPVTPTVYLEAHPQLPLRVFHYALMAALGWSDDYQFHPHLTIAEYVESGRAAEILRELAGRTIVVRDRMEGIALLERRRCGWSIVRRLPFLRERSMESEFGSRGDES